MRIILAYRSYSLLVCESWQTPLLFSPNSDSLGLLTLKAVGRRRVPGCRPGQCLRVSMVSWWCLDGVSVVSRWCLGGVPVVCRWSRWCIASLSLSLVCCWSCWSLVGLLLISCWSLARLLLVSCWFLSCWSCWSLAGLLLVFCWFLAGLLLVSCWFLLPLCSFFPNSSVVSQWCLGGDCGVGVFGDVLVVP